MGEATNSDLNQAAGAPLGDYWSFPRSQLYAEPQRLAGRGLLAEEQEETGRRRRVFRLTDRGRAVLRAWVADPETRPLELRDEGLLKLAFAAEQRRRAARARPPSAGAPRGVDRPLRRTRGRAAPPLTNSEQLMALLGE